MTSWSAPAEIGADIGPPKIRPPEYDPVRLAPVRQRERYTRLGDRAHRDPPQVMIVIANMAALVPLGFDASSPYVKGPELLPLPDRVYKVSR